MGQGWRAPLPRPAAPAPGPALSSRPTTLLPRLITTGQLWVAREGREGGGILAPSQNFLHIPFPILARLPEPEFQKRGIQTHSTHVRGPPPLPCPPLATCMAYLSTRPQTNQGKYTPQQFSICSSKLFLPSSSRDLVVQTRLRNGSRKSFENSLQQRRAGSDEVTKLRGSITELA